MTTGSSRKRVLILCTGNSSRSQMAEGWINHLLGSEWEARSAGTVPATSVHPLAVPAMQEAGIDLSSRRPEPVGAHINEPWDLVVTVCDAAREACPVFPSRCEKLQVSFPDPAAASGPEEERMAMFRQVRDAIRDRLVPAVEAAVRRRS